MSKIKVCHICNLGMNGKAIFLCNLLENSDLEKFDITIINFRSDHAESIVQRLEKLPVKILNPKGKGLKDFVFFLKAHLRENHYDVCHSHIWDLSGLFLAVAKRNGVEIRVAHSHNTSKAEGRYNPLKSFIRDKILWNYFRHLIGTCANRWVACSEEAAEWLFPSSVIKTNKHAVVINGIELERFKCSERKRHKPTEILFAGRLVYQKNPLFAIHTFYEYLKIDPTAHMTIVGSGCMKAQVNDEITRLGLTDCVTCVHETNAMETYYKNADVYLFPSNYEGLGITLIEAQSSGLKCLASDVVPRLSQCGLVQYKSLDDGAIAWAKHIQELLEADLAVDEAALQVYDAKNTAKQVARIYGL